MFNSLLKTYQRWKEQNLKTCIIVNILSSGSTYTKPGAVMLVNEHASAVGLISGGCLENELLKTAVDCIHQKTSLIRTYDMMNEDDDIWGSGSGCRGIIKVLFITENGNPNDFLAELFGTGSTKNTLFFIPLPTESEPFTGISYNQEHFKNEFPELNELVESSRSVQRNSGKLLETANRYVFCLNYEKPMRLLILGGGPDAIHLVKLAGNLDWGVTLADHRIEYLSAKHFEGADSIVQLPGANLNVLDCLNIFDAVILKSHHFETDKRYFEQVLKTDIPYIGLLGPIHRRERILRELNIDGSQYKGRLFSPAGINIKSYDPGTIAVSIIAQIMRQKYGRHHSVRN